MILRINKINNLLINLVIYGIVFFVPLCFALFFKTANVFELNKLVLFKILVLFLLLLTVVKLIFNNNFLKLNLIKFKRYYSKHLIIIFLFFLSLVLATIFSINWRVSIFGLYDRQQGLITQAYYILFFFLLLINIRSKEHINKIIITIALSSFFVAIYGLVQAIGFDPLNWIESSQKRIASTFGQPNYFASYILLVLPFSIYLFFIGKRKYFKWFWILVFVMDLVCLLFTYSRGAWVGLMAGLIFTIFITIKINKKFSFSRLFKNNKKLFYYFIILLFLLILLLITLYNTNFQFQQRIKSFSDFKGGSMQVRKNIWLSSLKAIKDKPFLGYGLENQGEVLVKYYDKDWALYSNVNVQPNRAHNLILDTLLTSGFLGLIAYLALLYLFFRVIIKLLKKENYWVGFVFLLSLSSYLISLLFNFSVIATDVYFWLLFALVIVLNTNKESINLQEDNIKQKQKIIYKLIKIVAIIFIGCLISFLVVREVNKLIADIYFRELKNAILAENHIFKSYVVYDYIKDTGSKEQHYDRFMGEQLAQRFPSFNEIVKIRPGTEILKNILLLLKEDTYQNNFIKAQIYTALGTRDNDYFLLAEENFKKVIDYSSGTPKNYRKIANMYYYWHNFEKAIENYNLALDKIPNIKGFEVVVKHRDLINNEKYLNYLGLKFVYEELNNKEMIGKYNNKINDLVF